MTRSLRLPIPNYQFDLLYEFNPSVDSPAADFGSIDITNSVANPLVPGISPTDNVFQGSQNLNFGFLASDFPGYIDAPTGAFDPSALGEYTFALTVSEIGGLGLPLETVVIVPAGSTAALLAPVGLLAMRRRRA